MVTAGIREAEAEPTTKKGISTTTTVSTRGRRGRGGGGGGGGRGPNGGGGPNNKPPFSGGGGDAGGRADGWSPTRYRIGVSVIIASVLMMFTALASAYIVRAGLPGSTDWRTLDVPSFIWASTALILVSSVTISVAQHRQRRGDAGSYRLWLLVTLLLGLGFLVSQLLAWRQLVTAGVYLASNPHSSFLYLFTGLHGLHLLGGILALSYLVFRAWRIAAEGASTREAAKQRTLTDVVSIYWHFMDVLWVFLFLLLFLWR